MSEASCRVVRVMLGGGGKAKRRESPWPVVDPAHSPSLLLFPRIGKWEETKPPPLQVSSSLPAHVIRTDT